VTRIYTRFFICYLLFYYFYLFLRDYSDSGEELSDDDIEIDYEDDEDDEEVVEVKPLPPVARSVYKKNDWTTATFCLVVSPAIV